LELEPDGSAPKQVRLLSAGANKTTKGTFEFGADQALAVMAAAKDWNNDYCFDYGHSMVAPVPGSKPADNETAAGWYRLKVDATGNLVTDNLSWTDDAAKKITKREIRYISPTFFHKNGKVTEWFNAALVGVPATKGIQPLAANRIEQEEQSTMKSLLAALSLSMNATEDEALAAVAKLLGFKRDMIALTGKSTLDEVAAEIARYKAGSDEVAEMTAEIEKAKLKKANKKVKKMVAKAIEAGKLPPSLEKKAIELGRKDRSVLKEFIKTFKEVKREDDTERGPAARDAADVANLTKDQLEVCAIMGLKPEDFAKTIVASGGKVPGSDFVGDDKGEKPAAKANGATAPVTPISNGSLQVKSTTTKDA
jgi:phage I-like protein